MLLDIFADGLALARARARHPARVHERERVLASLLARIGIWRYDENWDDADGRLIVCPRCRSIAWVVCDASPTAYTFPIGVCSGHCPLFDPHLS